MLNRLGKILVMLLAITLPTTDANSDANGDAVAVKIGDVFHRTMKHWNYSYTSLDTTKAGVACMRWQHIDQKFLDDGLFEAIGFSYSVAKEEAAIRIATQGCEEMARHYEVTDCSCEVVLVDDEVRVAPPQEVIDRLQ